MSKHSKLGKDPRTVRKLEELATQYARRKGQPWTGTEELDLRRAWAHGLSVGSIALIHGRSAGAIAARLRHDKLVDEDIYRKYGLWPDFTVEMCGNMDLISKLMAGGHMLSTNKSQLLGELAEKARWPQADAYYGYTPETHTRYATPLEFYYPQALALSAKQTYMRQGKLKSVGGMPTWDVSHRAEWRESHDLERAKELAGTVGQLDSCYTIKTQTVRPHDFFNLNGEYCIEGAKLSWPTIIYHDPEGNITATEQVDKPIDRSKKTKDVMVYIGSNVRQYDSEGNLRVAMGDLDHAFDASFAQAMLKDEAFLKAAKNAGFHIEAQAVQSSQCVDKHADTQINQEQEMQEKIQNAINLLEEGVVYPVCRFMTDGVLSGKQYTYKHRGDLEVGDVAVVITPAGHPALVVVEDFAHVTDLQKGIKYKWLAQVFDRSNYDALVAREDEARENLRKSITEKSRQEQLAALLGDLGESAEVKTARNMLSSKSNEQVISEHIEELAQKSRERMAKMVKEHPELKEVMEKIAGAFGHIPGMPPLFPDAEERN
ncbi:hypothetical protein AMA2_40 [Achromobacter phage AMA2]|nr:hypothetical protein AMA2_40 [Achromobacter phage AMA2]